MDTQATSQVPDKFDRLLGQLQGLQQIAKTKEATIRVTPPLGIGGSTTYVVTTCRQAGEVIGTDAETEKRGPATFTVFLEVIEADKVSRIVLPNEVVGLILRQRDALTDQAVKRGAKQAAATRKARGIKPAFLRRSSR